MFTLECIVEHEQYEKEIHSEDTTLHQTAWVSIRNHHSDRRSNALPTSTAS